jgi:soluble lytic murein transglycosylase-like protein
MNLLKYVLPVIFSSVVATASPTIAYTPLVVEQASVAPVELSLSEKILLLSAKYQVSADLARKIIWCESRNKPDAIGKLAVVGQDHSYWQINSYFHEEAAKKLGLDIRNPDDNLQYGFMLFARENVNPWEASRHCWETNF